MNTYKRLAQKFNVKLIDVAADPDYIKRAGMDRDHYINASYIIGGEEVILGIYKDKELKLISFFHEIGHSRTNAQECTDLYEYEERCWKEGIKLARAEGIKFSEHALDWAKEQLKTNEYKQECPIE